MSGVVVPVTETPEQIREAFTHTFYSAKREMGFEPDTRNLQALSNEQLLAIDQQKTLAFMIESVKGVENIQSLLQEVESLMGNYGKHLHPRQIVFWFGPYDGKKDYARLVEADILKQDMDAAGIWWGEHFPDVADAVDAAGFSVGGHMATLKSGVLLATQHHFRIFTIPGIADSFGNPAVPSTGGLFKDATSEDRHSLLTIPTLNEEEREKMRSSSAELHYLLNQDSRGKNSR